MPDVRVSQFGYGENGSRAVTISTQDGSVMLPMHGVAEMLDELRNQQVLTVEGDNKFTVTNDENTVQIIPSSDD